MRISFAIPVCNEDKELDKLLSQLHSFMLPEDEIVVQCDEGNTTPQVYKVLDKYAHYIKVVHFPLKGNFAAFKNNLKKNCTGDWIFQIDADEYLSNDFTLLLHELLRSNPTVDVFLVPRINIVEGLTQEHIDKWGWNVNERGWVNFPDYQTRIVQNNPKINWASKVHEVLTGFQTYSPLPSSEEYCLIHYKTIERQERQNNYYNSLR